MEEWKSTKSDAEQSKESNSSIGNFEGRRNVGYTFESSKEDESRTSETEPEYSGNSDVDDERSILIKEVQDRRALSSSNRVRERGVKTFAVFRVNCGGSEQRKQIVPVQGSTDRQLELDDGNRTKVKSVYINGENALPDMKYARSERILTDSMVPLPFENEEQVHIQQNPTQDVSQLYILKPDRKHVAADFVSFSEEEMLSEEVAYNTELNSRDLDDDFVSLGEEDRLTPEVTYNTIMDTFATRMRPGNSLVPLLVKPSQELSYSACCGFTGGAQDWSPSGTTASLVTESRSETTNEWSVAASLDCQNPHDVVKCERATRNQSCQTGGESSAREDFEPGFVKSWTISHTASPECDGINHPQLKISPTITPPSHGINDSQPIMSPTTTLASAARSDSHPNSLNLVMLNNTERIDLQRGVDNHPKEANIESAAEEIPQQVLESMNEVSQEYTLSPMSEGQSQVDGTCNFLSNSGIINSTLQSQDEESQTSSLQDSGVFISGRDEGFDRTSKFSDRMEEPGESSIREGRKKRLPSILRKSIQNPGIGSINFGSQKPRVSFSADILGSGLAPWECFGSGSFEESDDEDCELDQLDFESPQITNRDWNPRSPPSPPYTCPPSPTRRESVKFKANDLSKHLMERPEESSLQTQTQAPDTSYSVNANFEADQKSPNRRRSCLKSVVGTEQQPPNRRHSSLKSLPKRDKNPPYRRRSSQKSVCFAPPTLLSGQPTPSQPGLEIPSSHNNSKTPASSWDNDEASESSTEFSQRELEYFIKEFEKRCTNPNASPSAGPTEAYGRDIQESRNEHLPYGGSHQDYVTKPEWTSVHKRKVSFAGDNQSSGVPPWLLSDSDFEEPEDEYFESSEQDRPPPSPPFVGPLSPRRSIVKIETPRQTSYAATPRLEAEQAPSRRRSSLKRADQQQQNRRLSSVHFAPLSEVPGQQTPSQPQLADPSSKFRVTVPLARSGYDQFTPGSPSDFTQRVSPQLDDDNVSKPKESSTSSGLEVQPESVDHEIDLKTRNAIRETLYQHTQATENAILELLAKTNAEVEKLEIRVDEERERGELQSKDGVGSGSSRNLEDSDTAFLLNTSSTALGGPAGSSKVCRTLIWQDAGESTKRRKYVKDARGGIAAGNRQAYSAATCEYCSMLDDKRNNLHDDGSVDMIKIEKFLTYSNDMEEDIRELIERNKVEMMRLAERAKATMSRQP